MIRAHLAGLVLALLGLLVLVWSLSPHGAGWVVWGGLGLLLLGARLWDVEPRAGGTL